MSYLDKTKEEIEESVALYGLNDEMFFCLFDEAKEQQNQAWDWFYVQQEVFNYLLDKGYVTELSDGEGWEVVAKNIINSIKNIEAKIK